MEVDNKLAKIADFIVKFADKSEDVFWIRSPDYKTQIYISPSYERIWGRTCQSLYEFPDKWVEHIHPEDRLRLAADIEAERTEKVNAETKYYEYYRIIRPNNEVRFIKDCSFPLFDTNENLVGFAGIARDITEERITKEAIIETSQKLAIANKAKTELLAILNHEIRHFLNNGLGALELIKYANTNKTQSRNIDIVYQSFNDVLRLLDYTVDYNDLETGDIMLSKEIIALPVLLEDMVKNFAPKAYAKNIEIILSYPEDIPAELKSDSLRIYQVLDNFFTNALRFTRKGHIMVSLALEADQKSVKITVSDTGLGIPEEQQKIIFDLFNPQHKAHSYQEAGFRLSISKQLVSLMDGHIGVNTSPQGGAEFWFTLPLAGAIQATQTTDKDQQIIYPYMNVMKILIVSDNLVLTDTLVGLLKAKTLRTMDANSFLKQAKLPGKLEKYDLILFDQSFDSKPFFVNLKKLFIQPQFENKILVILAYPHLIEEMRYTLSNMPNIRLFPKPIYPSNINQLIAECFLKTKRYVPKILLIEEDVTSAYIIRALLEQLGCRVDAICNVIQALESKAIQGKYDLILVNAAAPEKNNLELLGKLSQLFNDVAPIIAQTADSSDAEEERLLDLGIDDVIHKPISLQTLRNTLEDFIPMYKK